MSKTEYPGEKVLDERLSHRNCVISIAEANLDGVTGWHLKNERAEQTLLCWWNDEWESKGARAGRREHFVHGWAGSGSSRLDTAPRQHHGWSEGTSRRSRGCFLICKATKLPPRIGTTSMLFHTEGCFTRSVFNTRILQQQQQILNVLGSNSSSWKETLWRGFYQDKISSSLAAETETDPNIWLVMPPWESLYLSCHQIQTHKYPRQVLSFPLKAKHTSQKVTP